jgi:hypothetical protein
LSAILKEASIAICVSFEGSVRTSEFRTMENWSGVMKKLSSPECEKQAAAFERIARTPQSSIVAEFIDFLLHNKKWWLAPVIVVILLVGFLVILGGTGAAPFIYTLF